MRDWIVGVVELEMAIFLLLIAGLVPQVWRVEKWHSRRMVGEVSRQRKIIPC